MSRLARTHARLFQAVENSRPSLRPERTPAERPTPGDFSSSCVGWQSRQQRLGWLGTTYCPGYPSCAGGSRWRPVLRQRVGGRDARCSSSAQRSEWRFRRSTKPLWAPRDRRSRELRLLVGRAGLYGESCVRTTACLGRAGVRDGRAASPVDASAR